MLQILCGLLFRGNMKYPCPFCLFDSYSSDRYNKEVWPSRTSFELQSFGVIRTPLISPDDIILPVLHIKLGLFKQFVKWMDKTTKAFEKIISFFSKIVTRKNSKWHICRSANRLSHRFYRVFLTSSCHGKNDSRINFDGFYSRFG